MKATGKLVRCLGPGDKEHFFYSANPSKHRICRPCQLKMEYLGITARYEHPQKVSVDTRHVPEY